MKGVDGVNISLVEIDQDTESVKITIEGESIDLNHVETTMKDCGAVIHSIDEVAVGKNSSKKSKLRQLVASIHTTGLFTNSLLLFRGCHILARLRGFEKLTNIDKALSIFLKRPQLKK